MRSKLTLKPLVACIAAAAGLLSISTSASAQLPSPSYGLNLGNTFETNCGVGCWGPPMPTQAGINGMAAAGFNTLRIPCAWHLNENRQGVINPTYMAQVTSVVNWALAANMYVIINDHYDGGWFEDCGFKSFSSKTNSQLQSLWQQVANNFKNASPHLLFACANEPNTGNSQSATNVLLQYYTTFVNTVRGTGGNNATRWLILQAPGASIDYASSYMPPSSFPADPAHSLMLESHFYDPFQFSQMTSDASWGAMFYFWGSGFHVTNQITNRNATWGEESYMSAEIAKARDNYIAKGIPVLAGEWRAVPKPAEPDLTGQYITQNYNSAQYWNYYFHNTAVADGLTCTCWQTDDIIDQVTGAVKDQGALNGVLGKSYPAPIAGL